MKETNHLKQKIRAIIFAISALIMTTNFSCEKACEVLALADLIIPPVADLLDQNGFPLIDPQTGQTIRAANEVYFNQRTGEYFNSDFPPTQGLLVGDIIQMGTNIFNTLTNNSCEIGANAPITSTAPELQISGPFFDGILPLQGMPTPSIPINGNEFTATVFQLVTPGNYSVDFNANAPRTAQEHSFNNNFYYGGGGNFGKTDMRLSFSVSENKEFEYTKSVPAYSNKNIAPSSVEEMKELDIYQFVQSPDFIDWYLHQLN